MSFLDSGYLSLFQSNWSEAVRTAERLNSSLSRLGYLFPLSVDRLNNASEEDFDKLDAFRVRFSDLQDCLGHKLFRNLLKLEEEHTLSMIDVLNKIEKRGILESSGQWAVLREIRNSFSHDYPESDQGRVDTLNLAWLKASDLIGLLNSLRAYLISLDSSVDGELQETLDL
jgi:hypothetical protein